MNELMDSNELNIESMIYEIRGKQVMLDSDLARLYHVETKQLNRQVKRNIERFDDDFCFQLTDEEYQNLRCQFGTSSLKEYGGRRYMPFVFTEYGVSALAGVLHSDIAVKTSKNIIRAFVSMRKYIRLNMDYIPNRLLLLEDKVENESKRIDILFDKMDFKSLPDNYIFFENQAYDAYSVLISIFEKSKSEIIIIDNYAGKELLDILSKIDKKIIIVSKNINETLKKKYESQYNNVTFINNNSFHDRFIIIDRELIYTCGASFKDLGKKCFYIGETNSKYINDILKIIF